MPRIFCSKCHDVLARVTVPVLHALDKHGLTHAFMHPNSCFGPPLKAGPIHGPGSLRAPVRIVPSDVDVVPGPVGTPYDAMGSVSDDEDDETFAPCPAHGPRCANPDCPE